MNDIVKNRECISRKENICSDKDDFINALAEMIKEYYEKQESEKGT